MKKNRVFQIFIITLCIAVFAYAENSQEELQTKTIVRQTKENTLKLSSHFVVDKAGNIYLLESRKGLITKLDDSGQILKQFDLGFISKDVMSHPQCMDIIDKNLVFFTPKSVHYFTNEGRKISSYKIDYNFTLDARMLNRNNSIFTIHESKRVIDLTTDFPWVDKVKYEALIHFNIPGNDDEEISEVKIPSYHAKFRRSQHSLVFSKGYDGKILSGNAVLLEIKEVNKDKISPLINRSSFPDKLQGAEMLGIDIGLDSVWTIIQKKEERKLYRFTKDGKYSEQYNLPKGIIYRPNSRFIYNDRFYFMLLKDGDGIQLISIKI